MIAASKGVAQAFSRAAAESATVPTPDAAVLAPVERLHYERHLIPTGGMICVLMLLMIVPEGFDYSKLAKEDAPAAGGTISRLLWLGLLGFGLVVILSRAALAWQVIRRLNFFLLAFVLLAIASVTWSIEPSVTLRRLIRVFTIIIASLAFVLIGWHEQRLQNVLRPILTLVLLGSIVFGLGWPDLAIHQASETLIAGAWRGLANHKNGLGDIACLGLIFWLHAWLSKETRALPALAGCALAAACLFVARSSTSVVATVFTLLFLVMLLRSPQALRRHMPWLVALFILSLLVYSLVLMQILPGLYTLLSPVGAITGKDMTFTGRTDIWDIMSDHISLHPYLGSGYGAYWTGAVEGTPSFEFMVRLNFYPGSAHNGYLDVLNELGALGLFVLFGYLAVYVAQSLQLLRVDRIQASLYLALFLQQAITNLSESRWFSVLSVGFVIMTLATTALARTLLEHHWRRAAGNSNAFSR